MKRPAVAILLILLFCLTSCAPSNGNTNSTPTEEIFPTLTPVPSTVTVAPDGSGNFTTLDEAVKKVKPESTIILSPGTHTITEKLLIEKEITLIGSGIGLTIVTSSSAPVLSIAPLDGNITLSGISFQFTGNSPGSVVYISTLGNVEVTDCSFSGGFKDTAQRSTGVGLFINAKSGRVSNSIFENNQLDGLELFGESTVDIDNSIFRNNGQNGLYTGAGYSGTVTGSEFSANLFAGISVMDPSTPIIEGNTITSNTEGGILYDFGAAGIARNNVISANGGHGISLGEGAKPDLMGNTITDNADAGIAFWANSSGTATGNECAYNQWGIYIDSAASPSLGENNCHDNRVADIDDRR